MSLQEKALDMIALKSAAREYVLAADAYQQEEEGAENKLRKSLWFLLREAGKFDEKYPG